MKAFVLRALKQPLAWEDRAALEPGEGQVVVSLKAAALNRRDYWITQGMYPGIVLPGVLGSDGAGIVTRLGHGVDGDWQDQQVIVNPGREWGENPKAQGPEFRILGMPDDGTFATEVLVPGHSLHKKPRHVDWHHAAALPVGGVTAYRALFTQGCLEADQLVLVSGVGGGVASFAMQFAVAAGATVVVTSSSDEKILKANQMGAAAGFNYTQDGWQQQLKSQFGSPQLIIDSAGGEGYGRLIDLAAPGGRIVNYGATAGPPAKLDLFKVFWKQLQIVGSTMGSPTDFRAMLDLVSRHKLQPVIDQVFALKDGNEALDRMKHSAQFGKIVLDIDAD